jgi:hypothetical protein
MLRFWNNEVLQNIDGVRAAIWTALQGDGEGPASDDLISPGNPCPGDA